jgi:hypothetical protein
MDVVVDIFTLLHFKHSLISVLSPPLVAELERVNKADHIACLFTLKVVCRFLHLCAIRIVILPHNTA